jgi:hypothetical protein
MERAESMIFELRPRQNIEQKQNHQRPEEYEPKVCQGTRTPDSGRE